ncbi:MAG: type I methionyl aminopeptidase [Ignavibacteria bacterium]|nr:type I methionyl aminopeptidase [Ignavibacteria bacterium]
MSMIKTQKEIDLIKESCKIVSEVFIYIKEYIKEGITTGEIDKLIEDFIISKNAYPAFKGYKVQKKAFPSSSCISVNEEVVHGLPGKKVLKNGDIVSIDVGVKKNGYYGDGAYTFAVGEISPKKAKLLKITQESLFKGIAMAVEGNEVNDISVAIQNYVEGSGYGVVRELVGHGIGKNLHEDPAIPNFYSAGSNQKLYEGMVLAIEPMVNYGTYKVYQKNDGWTISTKDEEPSAHFEHTVLVNKGKAEILTI